MPMRALLVLAILMLLAVPLDAAAQQQPPRVYRVGVLANALDTADGPLFRTFLDTLKTLGYVEDFTFRLGYARGLASAGIDKIYFVAAVPF